MASEAQTSQRVRRARQTQARQEYTAPEPVTLPWAFGDPNRTVLWLIGVFVAAAIGSAASVTLTTVLGALLVGLLQLPGPQVGVVGFATLLTAVVAGASWWIAALAWLGREVMGTTTFSADGIVSTGFTGLQLPAPEALHIRGEPMGTVRLVAGRRVIRRWHARTNGFVRDTATAQRIASALGARLVDERDAEVWERFRTDPAFRAVWTLRKRSVRDVPPRSPRTQVDHAGLTMLVSTNYWWAPWERIRITHTHVIHEGKKVRLDEIDAVGVISQPGKPPTVTLKVAIGSRIVRLGRIFAGPSDKARVGQMVWIAQKIGEAATHAEPPALGDREDVPEALGHLIETPR